ncbi:Cop1-interacting protein [Thalictrum thalictroides]|uniref:Cop1-interacting protein n=1 Tax=Thalictrum thalictroides TaxID=46969 RepID=A0A7J6W6T6_THATH|nr:Cop1-interacting protein [Thalictrum thalictroides]
MDELAAMEACAQPELPYLGTSGIILTTENNNPGQSIMQNFQNGGLPNGQIEPNGSGDASVSESAASHASSDTNQGQMPPTTSQPQFPMSWPNQHPQFMYNFPNHQMSPYQGYPFPGVQIPPQYQGNMQWPPNREAYGDSIREKNHHRKSSSKKKVKSPNEKESQTSEQDEHTESSGSTSEGEMDAYVQHDKKHSSTEKQHKRSGKKSSRMVVIRNINYITSKRKDGEKMDESDQSSLDEDEVIDGEVLKQSVEDAVGSLEKHKSTTRHSKKKSGNKTLNTSNGSINDVNQDDGDSSEGAKTNENWGAFQNLLLREDDSIRNVVNTQQSLDVRDEYFTIQNSESGPPLATRHSEEFVSKQGTKQRMTATDLVVLSGRDNGYEGGTHLGNFEEGKDLCVIKKKRDFTDEELLFSGRNDDTKRNNHDTFFEGTTESSVIKTQRGEDWFIVNQDEDSAKADATKDSSIFDADKALALGGNNFYSEKSNKNAFVDDSFMIQDRSLADDRSDSQWRTDISLVSGLSTVPQHESDIPDPSKDKSGMSGSYEPDDMYMMLDRNLEVDPVGGWATEVDYSMDLSLTEVAKQNSGIDVNDCIVDKLVDSTISDSKSNGNSAKKQAGNNTRSKPLRGPLGKSKTEIISRNKKPSTISRVPMHKSKFETEEETRKRMEELLIERQKRIAERTAARGLTSAAGKKAPVDIKKASIVKDGKRTSRSATH